MTDKVEYVDVDAWPKEPEDGVVYRLRGSDRYMISHYNEPPTLLQQMKGPWEHDDRVSEGFPGELGAMQGVKWEDEGSS